MIKTMKFFCSAALFSAMLVSTSSAQDAGLYENALDPTRAYVRVMVAQSDQANIGGSPVALSDEQVSGYVSVPPGAVSIGAGVDAVEMNVEAGTYYTFAQADENFIQFIDPPIKDPSKAEVLFYNLSTHSGVDLFVPVGKTNAMSGVEAGASQSVELRAPLTLAFEAQLDGAVLASVADVQLERKQAVSLFLTETAQGTQLVQVVNSFASEN
jgi:alginate O-acetyltransferase complex protein AlgF